MAAIDLINLKKFFGSVKAVNDLTLSISDKEFVALLGPSGCGKTTTMNMISGIEQPTAGSICFNGIDVSHVSPARRGIGFVFQNYAIFTHMTVRANLAFGLEIRREPSLKIARKVAEMAALMRQEKRKTGAQAHSQGLYKWRGDLGSSQVKTIRTSDPFSQLIL